MSVTVAVATPVLALAALLWGCSGDTTPVPEDASGLPDGWIGALVDAPADFGTVTSGPDRMAWIALHRGQLPAAARGFGSGVGGHRAWREQAALHQDLAALNAWTWAELAREWSSQDADIASGPLTVLAALAAEDGGVTDLTDQGGCLAAHLALRSDPAAAVPERCDGTAPLQLGIDGRRFQDPLVFGSRRIQAQAAAAAALDGADWAAAMDGPPDLDDLVFGAFWTADDLSAVLADEGAATTLDRLAPMPDADGDSPQAARDRARALDAALASWRDARHEAASSDGQALLDDLQLVEQIRSHTLVRWARVALRGDRPHQALAWLQLALDLESSRELGPQNRPSLFALLAEARARTGRTREALDALAVLAPVYPEVNALTETLGDLVVLQGMRRQGDSKEH